MTFSGNSGNSRQDHIFILYLGKRGELSTQEWGRVYHYQLLLLKKKFINWQTFPNVEAETKTKTKTKAKAKAKAKSKSKSKRGLKVKEMAYCQTFFSLQH